jgi:hypothetical protein
MEETPRETPPHPIPDPKRKQNGGGIIHATNFEDKTAFGFL